MKSLSLAILTALILGSLLSNTLIGQTSFLREVNCSSTSNVEYELTQLKNGRNFYGHCVRMPIANENLSLAYFVKESATQASPYDQSRRAIANDNLILVSSAGFAVQGYNRPLGLCVTAGKVVNYRVSSEMDGVVVIRQGRLQVYNRRELMDVATLGSGRLTDAAYKARFLNWIKSKQASVFQTHLLAADNELLIPASGRSKLAFRKILAQGSNREGDTSLFVFYIQQGVYLYDASKMIFDHLQRKLYEVDFMINLDTGAHDVFQFSGAPSTCFGQEVSGFSNVFSSSNLLVFYRP